MATSPDHQANAHRLWLFTTGEFSDVTVICYETSGFPERRFKLHRSILADLIDHAHPFLTRSQHSYVSTINIAGFPSPVVETMLRYYYLRTLDFSTPSLSVDRLIFQFQMILVSTLYESMPLCELAKGYGFEPQKDAEVYIAAFKEICSATSDTRPEGAINYFVRMLLQGSIIRRLPTFMISESFRTFIEERPDILSQLLPFILLPKDLPDGATDGPTPPVQSVLQGALALSEVLQDFGI